MQADLGTPIPENELVVGQDYLVRSKTNLRRLGSSDDPVRLEALYKNEYGYLIAEVNGVGGREFRFHVSRWDFYKPNRPTIHSLISAATNIGDLHFNEEYKANIIDGEDFKDGDAVVILERGKDGTIRHVFKESTLSDWFYTSPPPKNPYTRKLLEQKDIERATIRKYDNPFDNDNYFKNATGGKRKKHRLMKKKTRRNRRRNSRGNSRRK